MVLLPTELKHVQVEGEQSIIRVLQKFSDQSEAGGSMDFYPLLITLLKCTEAWRGTQIVREHTLVEYVDVRLELQTLSGALYSGVEGRKLEVSRLRLLEALHSSIIFLSSHCCIVQLVASRKQLLTYFVSYSINSPILRRVHAGG